ncbi:MAG TPA: PEGA domain-containing protein, partial [Polyangiaceae bacterium LLY-WYZ-15_(1-7)]|nr:PEGA domain-containing protein [Polyangiaceae bacterium LLY-WYZ-15_(1-7)]
MGGRLALLLLTAMASGASAQTAPVVRVEGPAEAAARWRARAEARGATPAEELALEGPGGIARGRLAALRAVEERVAEARRAAGQLAEGEALTLLTEARREAEAHADVPGAARWLAEVEAVLGVVAAQAGLRALSDEAFRRVATLDPSRVIRAAEAAPAIVERASALATRVATGPVGAQRVECDAPGARVFLDGRLVGPAPASFEAPVGRHLVRVEAPGRRPWGAAFDLLEGARAPMEVRLAPTEGARRRGALARAAGPREAARALAPGQTLWWLEAGRGPRDRALLVRCDAEGCAGPARLEGEGWGEPEGRVEAGALAAARRWRDALPNERPPPPPRP